MQIQLLANVLKDTGCTSDTWFTIYDRRGSHYHILLPDGSGYLWVTGKDIKATKASEINER